METLQINVSNQETSKLVFGIEYCLQNRYSRGQKFPIHWSCGRFTLIRPLMTRRLASRPALAACASFHTCRCADFLACGSRAPIVSKMPHDTAATSFTVYQFRFRNVECKNKVFIISDNIQTALWKVCCH